MLPCPNFPVLAVMFWPSCPLFPFPTVLSCLSSRAVLSCPNRPAPSLFFSAYLFPSRLSLQSGPCWQVLAARTLYPFLADLSRLACQADLSGWPFRLTFQADLSGWPFRLTFQADLSGWPFRLTFQSDLSGWLVLTDLSGLSCPSSYLMRCLRCHALTLLSWVSYLGCPISVVRSQLPCPSVMFWPSCPFFLVLPLPSWMSFLTVLSRFSCPGFPA